MRPPPAPGERGRPSRSGESDRGSPRVPPARCGPTHRSRPRGSRRGGSAAASGGRKREREPRDVPGVGAVGAVSPPERCSRSERSPDAELPGRCPKFYPAPPGVEPGRGRGRAGTALAPATAPATAPAPARRCRTCSRGVPLLVPALSPVLGVPAPAPPFGSRDPDSPCSNLVSAHQGRPSPRRVPALPSLRAGQGQPWGQTGPLSPSVRPVTGSGSVHGQGMDGLSSPREPRVKAAPAAAARGDSVVSNTETL